MPSYTAPLAPKSPRAHFFAAVCRGDANEVVKLIATGHGDINAIDPAAGMTVLMVAAMHGAYDLVFLFGRNSPANYINRTDVQGDSALMLAARGGHADVVALLLEWGAAIDQEDANGNTALMQLAANSESAMLRLLVDAGANPAHLNHAGQMAADLATAQGHHFVAATLSGIEYDAFARACSSPATGHPYCTSAAPGDVQASNADAFVESTTLAALQKTIEANDLDALKRILTTYRHSGRDVPRLLAGVGKLDTTDPFFADLEGTPLMAAAHRGYATLFPALLVAGAQINQAMPDGWTALLFAAAQGHVAAVRALIAGGADDQVDSDGDTALIFAARNGNTALVELLLEVGADKHHKNADGDTALIEATWKGDAGTVRELLKAGANPDQNNEDRMTALMFAARNGHLEIVRMLVQAGAELDQTDSDGTTALMFAAAQGHRKIVTLLLAEGADPDRQDLEGRSAYALAHAGGRDAVARTLMLFEASSSAATASSTSSVASPRSSQVSPVKLLKAIERNDARALKHLLDALHASGTHIGYEVNRPGKLKNSKDRLLKDRELTPLMLAAYLGHENLLALLIDAGAIVNKTDESEWSPLIWAAFQSDSSCVNALLKAGAEVDHANADEWTALMIAAASGFNGTVQALIDGGASVNRIAYRPAVTALKLAAREGHFLILQALIDAGAKVDMTTQPGGQTPLIWAARFGQAAIAKALLQAGADPNFKTYLGYKALDYAKDNRNDEMIELLRAAGKAAVKPRSKLFRKWFG